LIAKGGMGAVYEVVHANTGEHLALKLMLARSLLTPELRERFRREARIHSSVKDDHVVRVVDADLARELDDVPFLVMELLEGRDFERLCVERKPTTDEVIDWMRQLAGALDKAHREGIVHRDLKPENLFLAQREGSPPIVKILDFGVAKIASEADGQATATGQILGTPRYMAPEQAVDAKQISSAADRFALGLIAFRLLCGRHYFTGDNWVGLLREVGRGPQERPSAMGSTLGYAFDDWFARACALDPRARFETCAEQVDALAKALSGVSPARNRRYLRRVAAVVAAGGLAAAVWGFGVGGRKTRPLSSLPTLTEAQPKTAPIVAAPVVQSPPAPSSPSPSSADEPAAKGTPLAISKPGRRASRGPKRLDAPRSDAEKAAPKPVAPSDHIWDEP
jgi:serine/threonine-protein kinase